jgi:hypothetical protein
LRVDPSGDNAGGRLRVGIDCDSPPFQSREIGELRNGRTSELCAESLNGAHLCAGKYYVGVGPAQIDFYESSESAFHQLRDQRFNQHVAGGEIVVNEFSARYEHEDLSLVIGHLSLVIGHLSLVIGHLSLVIGHLSLVICHCY